ncbi:MAG: prephenate dehydrogenase [Bacteroidales bacterium]|jgi:prephenate dehydrogenase|nr:prephenate dehydrogenase [Bacteroidales bacterium]
MRISIIGLGLIGGSMAIDLKKRGFARTIIGVDTNKLHLNTALNMGIIDRACTLDEAIDNTDLIIFAIPAKETIRLLPKVLNKVDQQIITDACSVKGTICERVKHHHKRKNYVASHPMAGTENSGPWAAQSGLFDGKAILYCDVEDSSEQALSTIQKMYEYLNMRPLYMNAYNHDVHVAYVSHISHISSFALALTVLDKEKNEKNIFNLASGGFDSTVRLAKSSADMWSDIFENNSVNVISVLDTFIDKLNDFKTAINDSNLNKMNELIQKANHIKKIL